MLYFLSFFNGRLMGCSKKDHRVTGAGAERLTLTLVKKKIGELRGAGPRIDTGVGGVPHRTRAIPYPPTSRRRVRQAKNPTPLPPEKRG